MLGSMLSMFHGLVSSDISELDWPGDLHPPFRLDTDSGMSPGRYTGRRPRKVKVDDPLEAGPVGGGKQRKHRNRYDKTLQDQSPQRKH
jgi:hypothetical protein